MALDLPDDREQFDPGTALFVRKAGRAELFYPFVFFILYL